MIRQIFLAVAIGASSVPAWAHGELGGGLGMLSGVTHFLTSPLALAACIGLVVAVFVVDEKRVPVLVITSALAASLGAISVDYATTYLAAVLVVLIGLTGVFAWSLSSTAAVLLALVAGFTSGLASELEPPTLARALGVAATQAALLAGALYTVPALDRVVQLKALTPIARRVLASWVAAIGMLMAALAIHLTKL